MVVRKEQKQNTEEEKIICPICKSEKCIKWTKRKTQNRGLIQRYKCKDCGKTFVIDDGFFRMRNNPQKITCGLDLFYRGVSTRKVQEHFASFYPHNANHTTVYRWIVKYSKMISGFTDKLKVKPCNEVQVDEMEYHRRESHKKKKLVSKDWFIDSIDCNTRFMIHSEYVKSRGKQEIKMVLGATRSKTNGYVTTITTDGWKVYTNTVKQVFGYYNFQRGEKFHNVQIGSEDGFNIYIERLHNSIRERTKTFRGFHGSVDSANSIMKGWGIFYNFIRKHQTINCCPYELAVPNFKLTSNNKWLELINLANQQI